jgi:hypothetical protein
VIADNEKESKQQKYQADRNGVDECSDPPFLHIWEYENKGDADDEVQEGKSLQEGGRDESLEEGPIYVCAYQNNSPENDRGNSQYRKSHLSHGHTRAVPIITKSAFEKYPY